MLTKPSFWSTDSVFVRKRRSIFIDGFVFVRRPLRRFRPGEKLDRDTAPRVGRWARRCLARPRIQSMQSGSSHPSAREIFTRLKLCFILSTSTVPGVRTKKTILHELIYSLLSRIEPRGKSLIKNSTNASTGYYSVVSLSIIFKRDG